MKKLLLMVCLLACSSSGVAADHIPSPPPDVTKLCPDIEQATTTDAFKGFDRGDFRGVHLRSYETNFRETRSVPAGTARTDEVTRG